MGLNKEGANQKWYSHNKQEFSVIERSQSEGVKPKMRERRLRSDVNWQGALNLKGI